MPMDEITTSSQCDQRLSRAFYGFAGLLAVDICVLGMKNPDRGTVVFWIMLWLTFGQFFIWTLIAADRISRGRGRGLGVALVGIITFLIIIGALFEWGNKSLPSKSTRWNVLEVLRLLSAIYVLLLWVSLLQDWARRGQDKGSRERIRGRERIRRRESM